jgi:hypothetical protein
LSHTITRRCDVTNAEALERACKPLGATFLGRGGHKLFEGTARGLGVQLPGWKFPVVYDDATAEVRYDDYHGRWGNVNDLDRVRQQYAAACSELYFERAGYPHATETLEDGSLVVTAVVPDEPELLVAGLGGPATL